MNDSVQNPKVEEIDWSRMFSFTRLFDSFRMAVHPKKLMLALLLVVLLWVGGQLLNFLWGARVYPREFNEYTNSTNVEQFDQWISKQQKGDLPTGMKGVFEVTWHEGVESFQGMVNAALQLRLGLDQIGRGAQADSTTVVGSLYEMVITLPGWLWHAHRWFFVFYFVYVVLLWSLLGGTIARLAALDATREEIAPATAAVRYVAGRWAWFVVTPLMPMILACLVALVPVIGGFVFFNLPVLDVAGGFLFVIALACGAVIAFVVLLAGAAKHLFYPVLAVEGTDGFDAISRSFAYILGRPWRWLFYNITALIYGAIVYLFVATMVFLTLWVTQLCVGLGVLREDFGANRFDSIFPTPHLNNLAYVPKWEYLGLSGKASAALVSVWVYLVIGLTAAFAISFYFTVNTWIYLLLRRSKDGTEFDEVYLEPSDDLNPPTTPDSSTPSAVPAGGAPAPSTSTANQPASTPAPSSASSDSGSSSDKHAPGNPPDSKSSDDPDRGPS